MQNASSAVAKFLGMSQLEVFLPVILGSTVGWQVLFTLIAYASKSSKTYNSLTKSQKYQWSIHAVSQIHSVLVVALSIPLLSDPVLATDYVRAFTPYSSQVHAMTCGYFLWDILTSLADVTAGLGFLFHAVACFCVFFWSFVLATD